MPETVVHFQIRMAPELHQRLATWAKDDKASLNALVVTILEGAAAQHNAKPEHPASGAGGKSGRP